MDALGMYSDSDEEDDDVVMDGQNHNDSKQTFALAPSVPDSESPSAECDESTYVMPTEPPIIPSSPDTEPDKQQTEHVAELLKKHQEDAEAYIDSTFCSLDFLENPAFVANKLKKLELFQNDDEERRLTEYASVLSPKVFNPADHLKKVDNHKTLVKALEERIIENERKIKEKKERRQLKKQNVFLNQSKYAMAPQNIMNAAKQAVIDRQLKLINEKNNAHRSRWGDK